jgi:hypothetical protein
VSGFWIDSLITAAAGALALGDAVDALNHIALRNDAPALALRGIAMAQLGDLDRAKMLLRRAARAFGPREAAAHARCVVAAAAIALVSHDLKWPVAAPEAAQVVLEKYGDRTNAARTGYLAIHRLLLIGRLDAAERLLAGFDSAPLLPASRAGHELGIGGIAMRRLQIKTARAAIALAGHAAHQARIPSLTTEVEGAACYLDTPAARLIARGDERLLRLDEIESLLASKALVADACRRAVSHARGLISLETRPFLFALARTLAEAWPDDAPRSTLLARAFGAKHADESHCARLRVEIGRLRKALVMVAGIDATEDGFALVPVRARDVVVFAPPTDEAHVTVLALLADGEARSSSARALAFGASTRTVQRALDDLTTDGKVQAVGQGRARRWMAPPVPGFPTTLLLPAALSGG